VYATDEHQAQRDFWSVYAPHHDAFQAQIAADLIGLVTDLADAPPESGPDSAPMPLPIMRDIVSDGEITRRAMLYDEWGPYAEQVRRQGRPGARLGIAFAFWGAAIADIREQLVPAIIIAYGAEPDRLQGAWLAMEQLYSVTIVTLADVYLEARSPSRDANGDEPAAPRPLRTARKRRRAPPAGSCTEPTEGP